MNNFDICQPTLVMGLCSEGPYRYATENLTNLTVKWMNWGYNEEYVHPKVLDAIRSKRVTKGTKIVFCHWRLKKDAKVKFLREGVIDHISYRGGYVAFTVFLGARISGITDLANTDHFLCRYMAADFSNPEASDEKDFT